MKEYKKYLKEKIGGLALSKHDHKNILKIIATAVINNENGLGEYVRPEIVGSGDGFDIIKIIISEIEKNPEILNKIMDLEDIMEYDTGDVQSVLKNLKIAI